MFFETENKLKYKFLQLCIHAVRCTMVQISQNLGCKHWATCLSVLSLACTAQSFTFSALLACSAALICPWESGNLMSQNQTVLNHSEMVGGEL